ncbi:hypothetical protein [Xanthobacter aminoxidans]|uniref:hypothetical protein n=1 Tax=Xanthobacter aminoxidans TaxID=186280 RepID=UPI0020230E9D|nr:hypothetical protein [Xanthobacter aminoxidans]MCL8385552.1 hypothetical protein [Xanthobacter aminoxidans]
MGRKTVDIEALLRWAYREELPKAAAGGSRLVVGFKTGWGGVERFGELLAVIDEPDIRNRYGLVPDGTASTDPHPDAVRVHDAVMALRRCDLEVPEGWAPLSDMGDLGPEGAAAVVRGLAGMIIINDKGARVLRRSVTRIVIRQAILGGAPEWEGETPERHVACIHGKPQWFRREVVVTDGAFGPASHEIEVDGFDHRRRMPYADAYTKMVLDPDPVPVVQGRAEYELWRGALDLLAEDLAGALDAHAVLPSDRSARPWETPDPERRILPSLLKPPLPERESRAVPQKRKREAA